MIKVIIFDLGNTTVFFDHNIFCRKLAKYSPLSAEAIHKRIFNTPLETLFVIGKISPQKFYREVVKRTTSKISYNKFKEIFPDLIKQNYPIVRIIKKLRKKYRLLLLSNTNIIHFSYARKKFHNPLLENFSRCILSYKIGMKKPDKNIYDYTIKAAKAKPSEIIFIDDLIENIRGAKKAGIHGLHYTSAKRLVNELKRLGVSF